METKYRIMMTVAIGAMLLLAFYFISYSITKYTGFSVSDKTDTFESCLNEKDITLYINTNDPVKTLNDIQLSKYLKDVKVFNCQLNNEACVERGVNGPFPTWVIGDNKVERDISVSELATFSGCKF